MEISDLKKDFWWIFLILEVKMPCINAQIGWEILISCHCQRFITSATWMNPVWVHISIKTISRVLELKLLPASSSKKAKHSFVPAYSNIRSFMFFTTSLKVEHLWVLDALLNKTSTWKTNFESIFKVIKYLIGNNLVAAVLNALK